MINFAGLFSRGKRADGYPGKGLIFKPKPLRRAEVDRELCAGCGDCSFACYYNRIRVDRKGKARVRHGCTGCGACMRACPGGALKIIDNG